eukprot:g2162.t1
MVETTPIQLVDGSGVYNTSIMADFAKTSSLATAGLKYQVVAIMGPQSSGKSTLMNHVFGTRFQEMDAVIGRKQTTKGIWLSRAPNLPDLTTLVFDLEGTDGRERGEDDTTFERQSALFALAVSDVVMINIWCHDIGREHGAGKPLIKTVLQVNLKLFTPSRGKKKTVLVFVIRDKSKTPLEMLKEVLEQDMLNIWDSIIKPKEYEKTSFNDFFEVRFEALSNFEEKETEFITEAADLRTRFTLDGENSFVKLEGRLPGDAVPLSTEKVWEVIKSHKDLDLPAHKIMVATTRCSQIQHDQLEALKNDLVWEQLMKEVDENLVDEFGARMGGLVDSCITGYDEDAMYFDEEIRDAKRAELIEKVLILVKTPYEKQMGHLHSTLYNEFEKELKLGMVMKGVQFSDCAAEYREAAETQFVEKQKQYQIQHLKLESADHLQKLLNAIDSLVTELKQQKMTEVKNEVESLFASILSNPAIDLFNDVPQGLWVKARQILETALSKADSVKNTQLRGYDLTGQEQETLGKALEQMSLKLMDFHAKEAAHTVLSRMKDKFSNSFSLDENRLPRTWTAKDNLSQISKTARLTAAEVLAQLSVSQPRVESPEALKVEQAILLMVKKDLDIPIESSSDSNTTTLKDSEVDVMVAVEWPGVGAKNVLIDPSGVRTIWRQFMSDTKMQITQASMTQMANRLASNRAPPLWAIVAMLVLGFNEFMTVLYSPILALALIMLVLFIRSLYIEMDVDNEMQKGALPGAMSLAAKFVPSVKSVSSKTLDSISGFFDQAIQQEATHSPESSQNEASSSSDAQSGAPDKSESGASPNYPAVVFESREGEKEESSKDK